MSQILIKNITHEEKVGKETGKNYTRCIITVWNKKDGKNTNISGFGDGTTKTWSPGDTVDVDLSQTDKGYWNFTVNENSRPSEDPVVKLLKLVLVELQTLNGKKPEATAEEISKDFEGSNAEELGLTAAPVEEEPVEFHKPDEIDVNSIPF